MFVYNYIIMVNCNLHCIIYICQDGGAVGFVDFTKLSFALSSIAQPFDQMGSIPEYVFVRVWGGYPVSVPLVHSTFP